MKISSTSGKGNFILEKENNQILELILQPSINWRKLSYNYEIESISEEKQLTELLIYCGFGANLYMTMTMAAAAG